MLFYAYNYKGQRDQMKVKLNVFICMAKHICVCVRDFPTSKKKYQQFFKFTKKSYSVEIETNCLFKIKFYAKRKMSVEGCSKYSSEQLKK